MGKGGEICGHPLRLERPGPGERGLEQRGPANVALSARLELTSYGTRGSRGDASGGWNSGVPANETLRSS